MKLLFVLSPMVLAAAVLCPPVDLPMRIHEQDSARYRWLHKPVHESRLLDSMENLDHWEALNRGCGKAGISLTAERHQDGTHSLRLRAPTTGDKVYTDIGRPWGSASALRQFAGEDWTHYNRISAWIYPDLPGFRVVSLLVVLHNDGVEKVPNVYQREGLDFIILKNHEWNHIVVEIAHLARDRVTGVEFCYRLQGNEPGATGVAQYDIDKLELQRVDADYFAGWGVWPGRIAYSHTGYSTGGTKTALASDLKASEFRVVRQSDGATVLTRKVRRDRSDVGEFQALDFSDVTRPGTYFLTAGDRKTEPFRIDDDVWAGTIRKALNFFFVERCGFDVPGSHRVCHRDWQVEHGKLRMVINGGWHDAGDLSQGVMNTSESVSAMLELAAHLDQRGEHPELVDRLMREARWGLDWILKTSFGDGFRVSWAVMDFWTNGILGDSDDVVEDARNYPYRNFMAASAEATAYRVLKDRDPETAADSLRQARLDWRFADEGFGRKGGERDRVLSNSKAVLASLDLYQATGERPYAEAAVKWAREIVDSQQRDYLPGLSLTGFFYTNPRKEALLHYVHPGYHEAPIVAMARLCEMFPEHADWMKWYSTAALYADYLKAAAAYSGPYDLLPASLYRENEWEKMPAKDNPEDGDIRGDAREQIGNGVAVGGGYRLRRFPVWHSRRGNNVIILPRAEALAVASHLRGDCAGADLAERQLQWVVGRNPFSQSLMYGEGYDFAPQYTAMSGDIVGSLPVGIQSLRNTDMPYYSTMNCYNHKEVWVHPVSRWISLMTELAGPAVVEGEAGGAIEFSREHTAAPVRVIPSKGRFRVQLPAGHYTIRSAGRQRVAALLPGSTAHLDLRPEHWLDLRLTTGESNGQVLIRATIRGGGAHRIELRAANLVVADGIREVNLTGHSARVVEWKCTRQSDRAPWIAVAIPDGRIAELYEVSGRQPGN